MVLPVCAAVPWGRGITERYTITASKPVSSWWASSLFPTHPKNLPVVLFEISTIDKDPRPPPTLKVMKPKPNQQRSFCIETVTCERKTENQNTRKTECYRFCIPSLQFDTQAQRKYRPTHSHFKHQSKEGRVRIQRGKETERFKGIKDIVDQYQLLQHQAEKCNMTDTCQYLM